MGHRLDSTRSFVGRPRTRNAIAALAMATGALVLTGGIASATGGHGGGHGGKEHKVSLCHATGSRTNPYVKVTVDVSSVLKHGHGQHDGPVFSHSLPAGTTWGDIIPAFDLGKKGSYPGKNMSAEGKKLLSAKCNVPKPVTTTTAAPTTTTTAAPTTTTTASVTTTTAVQGTTTSAPTTTTTAAATTTTTAATTTTTEDETTTTTGAVAGTTLTTTPSGGGQPSTTVVVADETVTAPGTLPVTGSSLGLVTVGLVLLAGGGAALVARRKELGELR